jgi:hypothetical protein
LASRNICFVCAASCFSAATSAARTASRSCDAAAHDAPAPAHTHPPHAARDERRGRHRAASTHAHIARRQHAPIARGVITRP